MSVMGQCLYFYHYNDCICVMMPPKKHIRTEIYITIQIDKGPIK